VIGRARALHEFIKPRVIADTKKMYTDAQFLDALVKDTVNPATMPGGPGPGPNPNPMPGPFPNPNPQQPGPMPGAGGGGLGGVPAFETLVTNRDTELRKMLPR
jgi:hypothetical protein